MITSTAIASFEHLLKNALLDHCALLSDSGCIVNFLPPAVNREIGKNHRLIAISISTYRFRVVTLFEFPPTLPIAHALSNGRSAPEPEIRANVSHDAYPEFVNMVCGYVNRGLQAKFRHSGMSTPFTLETGCQAYLSILDPDYVLRAEAAFSDSRQIFVMLAVCVADGVELDFQAEIGTAANESAGELELF